MPSLVLVAKGLGGQIELYETFVRITRKGIWSKLTHGAKGDKDIRLDSITAVQFKRPGLSNGYIQFAFSGSDESKRGVFDASKDENTVMFMRSQAPQFEALRNALEQLRLGQQKPKEHQEYDAVESLEKLASLYEKGLISADEFKQEKQRIFSRSKGSSVSSHHKTTDSRRSLSTAYTPAEVSDFDRYSNLCLKLAWLGVCFFPLGIASIVFGVMALRNTSDPRESTTTNTKAILGISLSSIGIVLFVIGLITLRLDKLADDARQQEQKLIQIEQEREQQQEQERLTQLKQEADAKIEDIQRKIADYFASEIVPHYVEWPKQIELIDTEEDAWHFRTQFRGKDGYRTKRTIIATETAQNEYEFELLPYTWRDVSGLSEETTIIGWYGKSKPQRLVTAAIWIERADPYLSDEKLKEEAAILDQCLMLLAPTYILKDDFAKARNVAIACLLELGYR